MISTMPKPSESRADVLVIGAGIGGLAAAERLLSIGLDVDVVEQAARMRVAGAGILLHPNALKHLKHTSMQLRGQGTFIHRQVVTDADGTSSTLNWADVWPNAEVPLAIHRKRLAEVMIRMIPQERISWSTWPVVLKQEPDFVRVTFSGGFSRHYSLVVGADGVHSWTRRLVDPEVEPHYLGQTYWRTTVSASPPFDGSDWQVWRGGGHFFGAMPLGHGRTHIFLQAALAKVAIVPPSETLPAMRSLARSMGGQVDRLVANLRLDDELLVHPAMGLSASRWTNGRIVLIGDSVHAVSPATTQGAALAIEDASVLMEEVRRLGLDPVAIVAFEARRRQRVSRFLRLARHHITLTQGLQGQASQASPVRMAASDSAGWYRRLYASLMDTVEAQ